VLIVELGKTESHSEDAVVAELGSWTGDYHVPGVALVQPLLPATDHHPHAVDVLVVTPTACVAIEVKGVDKESHGVVSLPANGVWQCDDRPLGIYIHGGQNPIRQANSHAIEWGRFLRGSCGLKGAHVTPLIVLNQHANASTPLLMDPSIAGGIAHPGRRVYTVVFQRYRRGRNAFKRWMSTYKDHRRWDASSLLALFDALEAPAPTQAELVAEGFSLDAGTDSVLLARQRTQRRPDSITPSTESPVDATAEPPAAPPEQGPATDVQPPTPQLGSTATVPPAGAPPTASSHQPTTARFRRPRRLQTDRRTLLRPHPTQWTRRGVRR
jgi:hypothetical protein